MPCVLSTIASSRSYSPSACSSPAPGLPMPAPTRTRWPGFTTDDFSDTADAVNAVAASGSPLAGAGDRGAAGRRGCCSAPRTRRSSSRPRTTSCSTPRPASRSPARRPTISTTVRLNNRLRGVVDAALGGLTLMAPDPNRRYDAAQAVFKSRDAERAAGARQGARRGNQSAREKGADRGARRHRAHRPTTAARPTRSPPSPSSATAATRMRSACSTACRPTSRPPCTRRRSRASAQDPEHARDLERGAERLVRAFARLGAAAGGDRPRHHLRRDGRHQHGAWRDGDARRLHDLRGAGVHPHQKSGAVRLFARHRACRSPSSSPARSAS